MRLVNTYIMLLFCSFITAQDVVDFEEFDLNEDSFLNGSDGSGSFMSGDIFLPNSYNTDFMTWSGWAISTNTDTTTPGFMNQYSAIAGSGQGGSLHYAVTYAFGNNNIILEGESMGKPVPGMYVTNNTYAYLSMRDGDGFSKKFGGATGDDPDYFLLTVKAFHNGSITEDSVDFYLADYRFDESSMDYIVDDWEWIDLSSLGPVDSLTFTLSSTDVGQFGMNTPAFFCVDNIFAPNPITRIENQYAEVNVQIYPNPTSDFIYISCENNVINDCLIYSVDGQLLMDKSVGKASEKLNIQALSPGTYVVKIATSDYTISKLIVKK